MLQRNFAYVGHSIALLLQENYNIHDFCGYVNQRNSYNFLTSQKDIKYSKLLLDADVHKTYKNEKIDLEYLNKLEKEYGNPFLWSFLAVDRVLMYNQLIREYPYDTPKYSHEDMLRILQVHAKSIIHFLETEKPEVIIFSAIAGVGVLLLHHIAKQKGIKTFIIHSTSMENLYTITERYDQFTGVNKNFQQRKDNNTADQYAEQAKKFLISFRDKPYPYQINASPAAHPINRKKQFNFLLPNNFVKTAKLFTKYLIHHYKHRDSWNDYGYISPWYYLIDASKRKIRNLIGVNDLYDKVDATEDFAFFPLHYEPEITTLLYAPYNNNQLHLIRQIAKSLPVHFKLYVKEHPAMVVYRPRRFYKELKKIPNVKLINPAIKSFDLISYAKLITAITGSAGWESTLLKKPVITFGKVFYNELSFVKNCQTMENLPYIVKDQLENFQYNEEELLHLIAALYEESADVNLQHVWEEAKDIEERKKGLANLTDLLAKKLDLKKQTQL